ncbi:MAG: DegV family protein [Peptococcaceae bacterium]|nr:DegV family protein [Peptococcaceae bacterium]
MNNFVISCCTPVDYSREAMKALDVETVFYHVILDGKDYLDDFGESISPEQLHQYMVDGHDVKTSQVSVGEYKAFFRPFLEEGRDILHITVSSGISGTYNSAMLAARHLLEEFPERKLIIVDSLSGSVGYGMLVEEAAHLRAAGKNIEEVREWVEEHRLNMQHYFFSTDLTYFIKGGRIPRYAGLLAQKMKICPIMVANTKGEIVMSDKIRTRKKAITRIVEHIADIANDGYNYNGKLMIAHSDLPSAQETAALIREKFPRLVDLAIRPLGATFSSHSGPGCVCVCFWGKHRVN